MLALIAVIFVTSLYLVLSDDELSDYLPPSVESTSCSDEEPEPRLSNLEVNRAKCKQNASLRQKKLVLNKGKKPTRPCFFCGKFFVKLNRHITAAHANEGEVKDLPTLPRKKRLLEFELLRKKGIYRHNMQNLNDDKALMADRNQGSGPLKICSICNGFFHRKNFHKHAAVCRRKLGPGLVSGSCVESLAFPHEDRGFVDLLSRFQDSQIGKLCRQDELILTVGRSQFQKDKRKADKKVEVRKSVMANMRTLASLYMEFKACAGKQNVIVSTKSMLERKNFLFLEEAIQNVTTKEDGTMKPGLKVKIGNLLKTTLKIMKGSYLIQQDDDRAEDIDKFESVLKLRWTRNFGNAEYAVLQNRQSNLRQPNHLPNEAELKKVRDYTLSSVKEYVQDGFSFWDSERYITLRNLIVCRLTLFNARRGGEPSRLLISDWQDAKNDKWIDQQRVQSLSSIEKLLLEKYKVMYQGGKGTNHLVPVLVPLDCVKALDILSDIDIRRCCDINAENEFLFPSTKSSMDHVNGWACTKQIVLASGVEQTITATQMRHRAATLYAQLEVPEDQRNAFFMHMGHSASVNKNVYQCPMALQEITQVGRYLADIADDSQSVEESSACSSTAAQDIPVAPAVEVLDLPAASLTLDRNDSPGYLDNEPRAHKRRKERSRIKWLKEDERKVLSYFQDAIKDLSEAGTRGALPGRKEILKFLEQEPGILGKVDVKEKIAKIHSKLFNERNKYRKNGSLHLQMLMDI